MSDSQTAIPLGSVVAVKWRDASAIANAYWVPPADAKTYEPVTAHTVGFLVRRDEQVLTVAQSVHGSDSTGGIFAIPAGWIAEVEVLQETDS